MSQTFYEQGKFSFGSIIRSIFKSRDKSAYWYNHNLLGTKAPIWLDEQDLWRAYTEIPHLNSIINKRAELLSLGKFRMRKIDTKEEVFKDDLITLIKRPNPLQSRAEFITQYSTFMDIYGNSVMYKNNKLIGDTPASIWNLPPHTIRINPTGNIFDQTKIEGIIESYTMTLGGQVKTMKPGEIILKNDNVGSEYIKSQSKIISLIKPLSNIIGAMKTANVMIYDMGGKGILTNASKDSDGGLPLGEPERKRIEKDYLTDHGIGDNQRSVIITTAALDFKPMSFPIKDMMLFEEIEQDFGIILDAYGVDRDIFASTKGATFENKSAGLKSTIQNSIQPVADDLCESLDSDFKVNERGLESFISFDHLPALQEDQVQMEQAYLYKIQALDILKKNGTISSKQLAAIAEVDFDGTGESEIKGNRQHR